MADTAKQRRAMRVAGRRRHVWLFAQVPISPAEEAYRRVRIAQEERRAKARAERQKAAVKRRKERGPSKRAARLLRRQGGAQ